MNAISIVIPCYNEEKNLKKGVLKKVNDYLSQQKFTWEVLICNDGSTDGSLPIVHKFAQSHKGFAVHNLPHGGKPAAVWGGIQKARYPIVLFTDMDQSTPLGELDKLLPWFNKGYDVVIGSRGASREGNSLIRKIGSASFLLARKMFLLPTIDDTQCGFKAMRTAVARQLFPNLQFFKDKSNKTGWRVSAYDVELLFMAQKAGYQIKEVPVRWRNEDLSTTKGDIGARYRKESLQMAKEVWRVKINDLKGLYENLA